MRRLLLTLLHHWKVVTSSVLFSLQRRRVPANDLQIGLQKIPGPEMLTSSEIKECNQLRNSENGFNHVFLCAPSSIVFLDYFYALKILALANKLRDSSVCRDVGWVKVTDDGRFHIHLDNFHCSLWCKDRHNEPSFVYAWATHNGKMTRIGKNSIYSALSNICKREYRY